MTAIEIAYIHHYQEKLESERWDKLQNILGTNWDLETLRRANAAPSAASSGPLKNYFIPLAMAVNPEIYQYVMELATGKKSPNSSSGDGKPIVGGGEYMAKSGESIKSTSELSKDQFLSLLGVRK